MNELEVVDGKKIENIIYEIRGKQVMLDSDLAKLYECKNGTKDINKAVKRNMERFPEDFYFKLTNEEYRFLRFQFGTSKKESRGGQAIFTLRIYRAWCGYVSFNFKNTYSFQNEYSYYESLCGNEKIYIY